MRCPQCDYMMGSFDAECPRCHGKGLASASPQMAPLSAPSAPVTTNTMAPTSSLGQTFCNHCGTPNQSNVAFCSGCGQHLVMTAPATGLAPSLPSQDGWITPPPPQVYPPYAPPPQYAQTYPPQAYPPQAYAPQVHPSQYAPPIQNNVNVVVTQQNNNRNSGGSGWLAALLVLMFGTPLGCIAIPAAIVLLAVAFQFAPMIIGIVAAISIGKSSLPSDKKAMYVGGTLIGGFIINGLLLMTMYAQHAPVK